MTFTKETLRRAWRTFLQAAIAYVAANLFIVDFTASKDVIVSALTGLAVSAGAAGISAVMNLQKKETEELIEEDENAEDFGVDA